MSVQMEIVKNHLLMNFSYKSVSLQNVFPSKILNNRIFQYLTSVRSHNSIRARMGLTFSYIYGIFIHLDLNLVSLFVAMREWFIAFLLSAKVKPAAGKVTFFCTQNCFQKLHLF